MQKNTFFPVFVLSILLSVVILLGGCGGRSKPPKKPTDPEYINAVELKLKFRELADQMLATMPNNALQGFIGMPTSFVDQNNTNRSSRLGRLFAEALFYEFNQRGFPTREYRLTGNITVVGARNDLALIPSASILSSQKWASIIVGTYLVDTDVTFINARMVRACDGLVQRTGQLVLLNTPIIARLAKSDGYFGSLYAPIGAQSGSVLLRQQR